MIVTADTPAAEKQPKAYRAVGVSEVSTRILDGAVDRVVHGLVTAEGSQSRHMAVVGCCCSFRYVVSHKSGSRISVVHVLLTVRPGLSAPNCRAAQP